MKERASDRILIKFTDKFWNILEKLKDHSITFAIAELEMNPLVVNTMRVQEIDASDKEFRFRVKIANNYIYMKISSFMRNFFGNQYDSEEIQEFIEDFNRNIQKQSTPKEPKGEKIVFSEFIFNPKDVRSTFLSLVRETYPHGREEEVVKYLTPGLKRDSYGNYYTIIGESDIVFTCHLDTASRTKSNVELLSIIKDGDEFIVTDGKSILGADDKSGVTILMYMISNQIPGVYWFFIGEERGGLGSKHVSHNIQDYPFMEGKKKCVSFDRRNYHSVITKQMGVECCSNEFAQEICNKLSNSGLKLSLDNTGIFTDSANFIDLIPECTNISVGYFDEHTHNEMQNITFLEMLCKAVVSCDWKSLKVHRKLEYDFESFGSHKKIANELKRVYFSNRTKMNVEDGIFSFEFEITDTDFESLDRDLTKLQNIIKKYGGGPETKLNFTKNKIKITLN